MTDWTHTTIEQKLSDGALDWASFSAWPDEARDHAEGCAECQAGLHLEHQLRRLGAVYRQEAAREPMRLPPVPSIQQLRARTSERTAIPALLLLQTQGLAPFPEVSSSQQSLYRDSGTQGGLDLRRTERGVWVHDPIATHLLVYAVLQSGPPILIHQVSRKSRGVSAQIEHVPDGTRRVVALSSVQVVDHLLWGLWLSDVYRNHSPESLADLLSGAESSLHFAELSLDTGFAPSDVRILFTEERLKPVDASVISMLKAAGDAGRSSRLSVAAQRYREAMEAAINAKDPAGEIQASLGVSIALGNLGFTESAETVIQDLARRVALDNRNAAWICREQALTALENWELEAAGRWLEVAVKANPDATARLGFLRVCFNVARGLYQPALRELDALWIEELPGNTRLGVRGCFVEALARVGRLSEAQARLDQLRQDALNTHSEGGRGLRWLTPRLLVDELSGRKTDWGRVVAEVSEELVGFDGRHLSSTVRQSMLSLISHAVEARADAAARHLMRLYFLPTAEAADDTVALLAVLAVPHGLLVLSGVPGAPIQHIRMGRGEFLRILHLCRLEALTGQASHASQQVADILFPSGIPSGPLFFGSNGLLADAPMLFIARQVDQSRLPILCDLAGPRRARGLLSHLSPAVASLADVSGDLPMADEEVAEADIRLRRDAVTRAALQDLPPVGLIHLGVHARRERGVPSLVLADGLLGPAEIATLPLRGSPIVLLSGCATSAASMQRGVERSLAGAFLSAGASAVIATRWPVQDREMGRFVQRLMALWPFTDPALAVASVCQQLRREGLPARIWSAPCAY